MSSVAQIAEQLVTVADYLRYAASTFGAADLVYGHGTDNPWDEAVALLAGSLDLPWDRIQFVTEARLLPDERARLADRIEQRVRARVPVAYLTGVAWFAGLAFHVDQRVLIPRSPIAELIDQRLAPWLPREPRRLADLCCGCGCIGIALAEAFPAARVDLLDNSADALAVADINIARHDLQARVRAIQADLLPDDAGTYDVIVANPPYVSEAEMSRLPPEYRHEPRDALAAGADGLDVVARILAQASVHLADDGILVLEAGDAAPLMPERWPEIAFMWPEFEHGGHGVAVIEAAALRRTV